MTGPTRVSPSTLRREVQTPVGVGLPPMFSSDFHTIQFDPSASVNTLGSIDPPLPVWQMNGVDRASNGPVGEGPTASPMHCMDGLVPTTAAV